MTTSQQWPTGRHVNVPPTAHDYPPQIPQQRNPSGGYPPPPAPKKRRKWPFIVGGIVALLVLIAMVNGGTTTPTTPTAAAPAAAPAPAVPAGIDQAQQQLDEINRQLEQRKAELSNTPVAPAAPVVPAPAPVPSGPVTTVGDGTYQVGTDMAAGRYKTSGPDGSSAMNMCYVSRNKNDSGEFDAIIANQIVQGPGSVTVKKGEFAQFSGGCSWTKQ